MSCIVRQIVYNEFIGVALGASADTEVVMVEVGDVARIAGVAFVVLRVGASREYVYVVAQDWDGAPIEGIFQHGWVSPAALDK